MFNHIKKRQLSCPGKSKSCYLGIWFNNVQEQTAVWVANRNTPINDTSGVLSINPDGNLVLHHNYSTSPIWSTSFPLTRSNSTNVIAQLSNLANLVLILNSTKTVIWQSFDHATNTLIPYLRIGFDRRDNQSWILQSWKIDDDPGTGSYTLELSSSGKPQLFLYHQNLPLWRGGSWNDVNHVALSFNPLHKSLITWVVIQQSGFFNVFTWNNQKNQWNRYWSVPINQCDNYGTCGSNVLDVRNGGSGCLAWHGNLIDIQKLSDQGQDLFVRVDAVELANYNKKTKGLRGKKRIATILIASAVASIITLEEKKQSLKVITEATRNFGDENMLGQGGFGSVYKGCLANGQEIAVKRLSEHSGQGTEEFKTEVRLLVKLQHRNLVRLLGCCFEKEERMLVYEYLPNKSLDFFIFDEKRRSSLTWDKRFEIILGIARGRSTAFVGCAFSSLHDDPKTSFTKGMTVPKYTSPQSK
ncbi:hypothetical protein VNO80_10958 [Phaseolus coccineus]|uniref:non-specific serine/threonine protein kinase n=1 Tax=Phaseolus coccineus TaxID=3886 RepID=A0AAN9N965_PHACN